MTFTGHIHFLFEQWRTIRQKCRCLNHLMSEFSGKHPDAGEEQGFVERGFICIKVLGFALLILSHLF